MSYLAVAFLSLTAASQNPGGPTQLLFSPTPNAPVGTRGTLDVLGPATVSISLQTVAQGTYEVTGLTRSNASFVFLGRVSIIDPTLAPSPKAGGRLREQNTTHQAQALHSRSEIHLPVGLNVSDLSRIAITDLEGNEIMAVNLR